VRGAFCLPTLLRHSNCARVGGVVGDRVPWQGIEMRHFRSTFLQERMVTPDILPCLSCQCIGDGISVDNLVISRSRRSKISFRQTGQIAITTRT
jgi:hypothetical protein